MNEKQTKMDNKELLDYGPSGEGVPVHPDELLGFDEWWAVNKVDIGGMLPIMQEAFREISLKAWNGALKAVAMLPDELLKA
jgi:hypothetical protein